MADVLDRVADDLHPVVLSGEWLSDAPGPASAPASRLTIIGSDPMVVADPAADPFALLDELPWATDDLRDAGGSPGRAVRVGGGWIGWLGYGLGASAEPGGVIPPGPAAGQPAPAFWLAFYDHLIIHDGESWVFEMLETPARAAELAHRLKLWRRRLREPPTASPKRASAQAARPSGPELDAVGSGAAGHIAAVATALERIAAGDLYQASICMALAGTWEGGALELFARGLSAQPRFGAMVPGVISLSPERFLRRSGSTVWTEPIKGTRPRSGEPGSDAVAQAELAASSKDGAEHVMIVDLMRNDLGRVCAYGSVRAQAPRIEAHAGVFQLVSTVQGRLGSARTDSDLLRATFPPGSVTGAPKIAAMQLIAELESTRRAAYTGAMGIVSPLAGLDFNVAIRTFELAEGRIWMGVGGGVVADSDPADELAEALIKAQGPLAAVGGRLADEISRVSAAPPGAAVLQHRRALSLGRRPDPTAGVFTTLLAHNGSPQWLAAHLQRLRQSVNELYGVELAGDLPERLAVAGAGLARGRIRVKVHPDGSADIESQPEPPSRPSQPPLELAPWVLPGGLGAHKWTDRALLTRLAEAEPRTVPLLLDGDGTVLEAAWANVWIVEADRWITPPADGRILAGVTRAALLANPAAPTSEQPFGLERLAGADAVFVTSSVSGRRPARLTPGRAAGGRPGSRTAIGGSPPPPH